MMPVEVDLHIHTKYSLDSFLEPKSVVKLALKHGLSAIAVTNHDTVKGGLATVREALSVKDLMVVPGVEVKTDVGDLIGLYVEEEISARDFYSVVDEIMGQGSLVVLPHPYSKHKGAIKSLASHVDVVEVLNGRTSHVKNVRAFELANRLNKPALANSDAHFPFEIGRVKTRFYADSLTDPEELRKLILRGKREFIGREASFIVHFFSFTAEIIKQTANVARL